MTNLQKAYSGLSDADREQLMIGFNGGTDQIIDLSNGYFLGVNIHNRKGMVILEEQNHFIYGRYTSENPRLLSGNE